MFTLRHEHGWSIDEIDKRIPYERDILIAQLNIWIKKKNEKLESAKNK